MSWTPRGPRRRARPLSSRTEKLSVRVSGQGLYEITREVKSVLGAAPLSEGLCTIFIPHTSASLVIQENADPSAAHDLERWLQRLVPEGDSLYTHTAEGADDMPAHVKAALTASSLSIPVSAGSLVLGVWQGIYLWEHRTARGVRHVFVHLGS